MTVDEEAAPAAPIIDTNPVTQHFKAREAIKKVILYFICQYVLLNTLLVWKATRGKVT